MSVRGSACRLLVCPGGHHAVMLSLAEGKRCHDCCGFLVWMVVNTIRWLVCSGFAAESQETLLAGDATIKNNSPVRAGQSTESVEGREGRTILF